MNYLKNITCIVLSETSTHLIRGTTGRGSETHFAVTKVSKQKRRHTLSMTLSDFLNNYFIQALTCSVCWNVKINGLIGNYINPH